MRGHIFLIAIVVHVFYVGAAPPPDVKTKALAWLAAVAAAATDELTTAQADLVKANTAVQESEKAVTASREEQNPTLESRATAALATARTEAANAQARIAKAQAKVAKLKQVTADAAPGATGFALETKGTATILTNGQSKPWNGSPAALSPGDTISVGNGGRLVMAFDDGHEVTLNENTVFQFVPKPNANADAPLLDRALGYLRKGVMRVNNRFQPRRTHAEVNAVRASIDYRTPAAVAAVRGTDFQLKATEGQPTRFIPLSGEVEIGADATGLKGYAPVAWWPTAAASPATAIKDVAVLAMTGKVSIEHAGAKRPAAAGQTVATGDHILVEDQAGVVLKTVDGHRIAVGAASRLDIGVDPASKGAVYVLRKGRMHVWGDGAKTNARFLTPNSVAAGAAKEFEVSIGEGGTAEYLPLDGSLTVTAVASRLDWSKLPELAN